MSACEKCWGDAYARMREKADGRSQADHYSDLLRERKDNPCTPEQQRGSFVDADRRTVNAVNGPSTEGGTR